MPRNFSEMILRARQALAFLHSQDPKRTLGSLRMTCPRVHILSNTPRFNETRGKVRARRIYVAFQAKKHFRVSHWKNCRCLVDGLQIGLQRRQLGRSQLFLHFFFDNPEAAIQLAHPVL